MVRDPVDNASASLNLLNADQNECFGSPPTVCKTKDVLEQFRFLLVGCLGKRVLISLEIQSWAFVFIEQLIKCIRLQEIFCPSPFGDACHTCLSCPLTISRSNCCSTRPGIIPPRTSIPNSMLIVNAC